MNDPWSVHLQGWFKGEVAVWEDWGGSSLLDDEQHGICEFESHMMTGLSHRNPLPVPRKIPTQVAILATVQGLRGPATKDSGAKSWSLTASTQRKKSKIHSIHVSCEVVVIFWRRKYFYAPTLATVLVRSPEF